MSEKKIIKFLKIAQGIAVTTGKFLARNNVLLRRVNKEDRRDVKIEADLQSERMIIDLLTRKTEFSILSEEKGLIEREGKDFIWIVDPVDGSLNYSRGIPLCCVSIGFWKKDEPVLGVIYDFYRNELFSGIVNKGAWLNGVSIKVSNVKVKEKGILCTGFPAKTDFSKEKVSIFLKQIRVFKKIRLLGTAALSMAYVACGRAEGYYENDIMFWDIAAGIPIVLGAGGKINVLKKASNKHSFNVYLTNGIIEYRKDGK